MATTASAIAQPAVDRVSITARASAPVMATRRPLESSQAAIRLATVATVSAVLQMYTSWYTHGCEAR